MKPVLVFRHVAREPLGTIDGVFRRAGVAFQYVDLYQNPPREFHPELLAGLVVLGGPMNVDEQDRFPFLATEIDWIRQAIAAQIPVLGICLGSQLIAAALGAPVRHNPTKEIGWYEVETTPAAASDPLLRHFAARETIFQWHGDTFDLPAGAEQLARSAICEQQAFRYGRQTWALQFHLEVTPEIIDCWIDDPDGCAELSKLDYIDPAQVRREVPRRLPPMQRLADQVFGEFAALCQQRAGG